MTLKMDPDNIVGEGQRLRSVLESDGRPVIYEYAPGNMTLYVLAFLPVGSAARSRLAGEPSTSLGGNTVVSKLNGTPSLTWSTCLPLLPPAAPLYLDPGYLKGTINCTPGDVGPLGLLLNAVAGIGQAQLDASPYLTADRALSRAGDGT